jgi:type I restriction-modification system DNA methylase subunit
LTVPFYVYEELNILKGVIGLGGMPLNQTSSRQVTDEVRRIVEDIEYLSRFEEVGAEEFDSLLNGLKSEEVKRYINYLLMGSKPESALREALFAGDSVLFKYLCGTSGFEVAPEVVEDGFVDYLVKDQFGHVIVIELKSLFDTIKDRDKSGRITVKGLKQKPLSWEKHRNQIKEYIAKSEYVVLSNLKEWVFFSRSLNPVNPKPFFSTTLRELVVDLEVIGSLKDYCDRKESQAVRYELDKKFLESLKQWVEKLSEIEFTVDDKLKLELIIGLINKFIFIQTLDDYGVVDFKWIQKNWEYYNSSWIAKGKLRVLEEFFKHVDQWFYAYYDTELFREDFLRYVKKDPANIDRLYENLRMVLGITYFQTPIEFRGIMQYNFRLIDEDVLGKAYEIFLAEQRKEQGAYYTPKYITEYIVENTVGRIFKGLLDEINKALESEDFDKARELVIKFTSIKVLDPACGSGSFLIKALRKIKHSYDKLIETIKKIEENYVRNSSSLESLIRAEDKLNRIHEIRNIVGPINNRELLSTILLRHIYGNDLDKRAIEVAKLNIWLEVIKLAPSEFRFDRLPTYAEHILPNLEMNLCNGDSLIGLPDDLAIKVLERYRDYIVRLNEFRNSYLRDPSKTDFIGSINDLKNILREKLDSEFRKYLVNIGVAQEILDKTKPFHWALEYWYAYFDVEGRIKEPSNRGFEIIIGNPPYVENKRLEPLIKQYLKKCGHYKTVYKLFDYAVPFIEKAYCLLVKGGRLGYIVTNKFTVTDYGVKIRELLVRHTRIEEIVNVSDLPVFKGVATYPIILIFSKEPPSSNHEFIIVPNVTSEEQIIERNLRRLTIKQESILRTPQHIFDISGNISLCEKIRLKGSERIKDFSKIGYRVLKFTGWDEYLRYVVCEEPKGGDYLKFIGCGNILPYYIDWSSELKLGGRTFKECYLVKSDEFEDEKWQILRKPKILIREVGSRLTAAIDEYGEYGNLTGLYMIYDIDKKYDAKYILALLNSCLLDFYYKSLFGSTHMAGGYLNFHGSYIEHLPIYLAKKEEQEPIIKAVDKIVTLKKIYYKLIKSWNSWSVKLKTSEVSLYKLLLEDLQSLREGRIENAWIIDVTFHPDMERKELEKKYLEFNIVGEDVQPVIRIYGIVDGKEEHIYTLVFKNRDLMLHVYISILLTLESRRRIQTLRELFEKTLIPIIVGIDTSSSKLTPNILKRALEEVNGWIRREGFEDMDLDIVRVNNIIEDVNAKIDALIFKLYGLNEDEVEIVLNFLKTRSNYRQKILAFFKSG